MDHGLMHGMFWGGVLLSSIPLMVGIGIGVFVLRRHLQRGTSSPRRTETD